MVSRSVSKLLAMILMLWLILPVLGMALLRFVNQDELLVNLVDLIPFGDSVYWVALKLLGSVAGATTDFVSMKDNFSMAEILKELAKSLFASILFEAGLWGCSKVLGLTEGEGFLQKAQVVVLSIPIALVAASLSPLLLDYIFSSMGSMGNVGVGVLSALLSLILLGGGFSFFFFFLGGSVLSAVLFMAIKILLLGMARLYFCYVVIFVTVIALQNNQFGQASGFVSLLVAVLTVLCLLDWGIDLVLGGSK